MAAASSFELVKPESLTPHPRNPRTHDTPRIIASIRRTGWHSVITAQRSTGHILVGHGRTEAARYVIERIADNDPEWTEWAKSHPDDPLVAGTVPVEWKDLDDGAALDKVLADNKASDEADYDRDLVAQLLVERWAEDDLEGTGWTKAELDELQGGNAIDGTLDASPQLAEYEYRIVVRCVDEKDQGRLLERLRREGLNAAALTS